MEGDNWMDIRNDRQKGMSYTEIARKYNMDPHTSDMLRPTQSLYTV